MSFMYSESDRRLVFFEGAVRARVVTNPTRAFAVEVTFVNDHPRMLALKAKKPPIHFHSRQEEYFRVLEGGLGLELEGKEMVLGPDLGEFCIPRWHSHRIFPPPDNDGAGGSRPNRTRALVSGQQCPDTFKMDLMFFENWCAWQDELVSSGKAPDMIQLMCMWDSGDSYLSPPSWVPFGKVISKVVAIVLGRWIGGLLGYQPYFQKWTSDWSLACERMRSSTFWKYRADS
ncbi:hypothetical protein DL769_003387 [Monosporascus sp. CRB-8-3]|nr:hypothetical protein DL769_003387 [Monosporascus sp. CRB-8-3]